jgi:hypothetical protein
MSSVRHGLIHINVPSARASSAQVPMAVNSMMVLAGALACRRARYSRR